MTEQAPVAEEDREAADAWIREWDVSSWMRDGDISDEKMNSLAEAFRNHRLQAIATVATARNDAVNDYAIRLQFAEATVAKLTEERDKFRNIVRGWVDAVTSNGANRENWLSINHDIIKGMVHASRHALASSEGEGDRRG